MGNGRSRSSPVSVRVPWIPAAWPVGVRAAFGQLSWKARAGKLALPSPLLMESLSRHQGGRNQPGVLAELSQGCREAQRTDVFQAVLNDQVKFPM